MKELASNSIYPPCPIRHVLSRISGKWSLLVLYTLSAVPSLRFMELRRQIGDVTPKMLAASLVVLEEDGFVCRTVFSEVPLRVEYSLTTRGRDFFEKLQPLIAWTNVHMEEILRERARKVKEK